NDLVAQLERHHRLRRRSVRTKLRAHHFRAVDEEDFLSVDAEVCVSAALCRDGMRRSRPRKWPDVNLGDSGGVGAIDDPFAVARKARFTLDSGRCEKWIGFRSLRQ